MLYFPIRTEGNKLVISKYRMSIVNYPAENFRCFVWKLVHFRRLSWKVGVPNVFDCFLDNINASSESRFGKKFSFTVRGAGLFTVIIPFQV